MVEVIDRGVAKVLAAIRWLALPIAALLFLQWPLREFVHAYSREANDLGQWLFAIFVAASVVAATRAGAHLASDAVALRYSAKTRWRIAAWGVVVVLVPWALFVLWSAWPMLRASAGGLERFPDTGNPGYFILKLALALLMGLIVLQASVDVIKGVRRK
jgi:TRAP-type mannitol/chloroaromatic compound transport system permease small subunit